MQKIAPFLWFNDNAEQAMEFYCSVFKDSKIVSASRYGKGGPGPEGSVIVGSFLIEGQEFIALNGGPLYNFTPAISFVIRCEEQEEVDYYWNKLSEGGREDRCAWLQDKFGVSWQVVPNALMRLMGDKDPAKSGRVMQAMLKMKKIIIADLQAAYDQA